MPQTLFYPGSYCYICEHVLNRLPWKEKLAVYICYFCSFDKLFVTAFCVSLIYQKYQKHNLTYIKLGMNEWILHCVLLLIRRPFKNWGCFPHSFDFEGNPSFTSSPSNSLKVSLEYKDINFANVWVDISSTSNHGDLWLILGMIFV